MPDLPPGRHLTADVIDVLDDVLCVRRQSYLTCSYLIRRGDAVVLVDAGMKTDGSDVLVGLAHWGVDVESVRAILVTHWHNDHSAGAARVKELSRCSVRYSELEAPWLLRATATEGLFGWLSDAIPEAGPLVLAKGLLGSAPMTAVTADAFLSDGESVEGLVTLETPGHTVGHLSFYDPVTKVLFAGDALAAVDGELRFMARPVTLDQDAARASMVKCMSLDVEWVCAGHREPMKITRHQRERFLAQIDEPGWPLLG